MAYRYFEYTKTGLFLQCFGNWHLKGTLYIRKNGQKLVLGEDISKLQKEPIKIKKEKFDDVQQLATKYVPKEHQWFYLNLKTKDKTTTAIDSDNDQAYIIHCI